MSHTTEPQPLPHAAAAAIAVAAPAGALCSTAATLESRRALARLAQRVFGASLTLAAGLLWLAPGTGVANEMQLIKLLLSVGGGMAGLGLLLASAGPAPNVHQRVEIDTIRRELRLVSDTHRKGEKAVHRRIGFAELAPAERDGSTLRLRDGQGAIVAEVTLGSERAFASLLAGLHDARKL